MLKYFFDLPVYRIPREDYYSAREKWIDAALYPPGSPFSEEMRARDARDPSQNVGMRAHFERAYGGCWEFNEIIGYIRLHFLGTQVRGEYFAVSRTRIVRTRKKTLEYQTWKLAPEVNIRHPYNDENILAAIRRYIDDCRKEVPRRFIDTSMFDATAEFIDWASLFLASTHDGNQ